MKRFRFNRGDWRLPPAQLRHVDLTLAIFDDRIEGRETLHFEARETFESISLDAQDLEIGGVAAEASGAPGFSPCAAVYDKKARRLSIALPRKIGPGERFRLRVSATCRPTANILDGAYFDVAPAGAPPQIISQCQQWGFQRIMPIVDDCTAKCTWHTTLEASARYTHLVSNGDIDTAVCPEGRPVPLADDPSRVRIAYRNAVPMPPYLFLVAAGSWDCLAADVALPSGRTVRLEYLVPPGEKAGAALPMEILKKAAVFQARFTGCEYERECYRTICMEKSNFGGMENVGNTTIITEAALLDKWTSDRRMLYAHGVIVHEFEHNHCGSGVTMKTPFDMWLNEAYTVTVERAFVRECFGEVATRLDELSGLRDRLRGPLAAEAAGASFPIVRDGFDSPDDVVDGVTYDKAPEVLGMLRALLGPAVYDRAMAAYFERHRGGNVETADFIAAFPPSATLDRFFREWLFTTGYPGVECRWAFDETSGALSVTLSQTRVGGAGAPFVVPVKIRAVSSAGRVVTGSERLLVLDSASQTFTIENLAEAPAFLDLGSGEPFYGTIRDASATPASLALAAKASPFAIGRVEAVRELASRAAAGDSASRAALLCAMEAALCDGALDLAARAAILGLGESDIAPDALPAGPARAVAARAIRRAAALEIGFDRLAAALDEVRDDSAGRGFLPAGIPARAFRKAVLALAALAGGDRAVPLLRREFDGAACVEALFSAVQAAQDAGLAIRTALLGELRGRCAGKPGAFAAYLALVGADPAADTLFPAVEAAQRDAGFRPEHPGHARSLYAAVSRNAEALWTARGRAWFVETLPRMAEVNENVAIVMLGAIQDWRRLPDDLRPFAEEMLSNVARQVAARAPGAVSLLARIEKARA